MTALPAAVSHEITDRAEWLRWRREDVTASDIAACCGCHPHKTALSLWAEKSGEIDGSIDDNPVLRRGRWLEAAVIEALRETRPELNIVRGLDYYRIPDLRIGATPDAFARNGKGGQILVECKTVSKWKFDQDWLGDDDTARPPMHYILQALTAAMVTGCEAALIAVLVVDAYTCDLLTFDVPRHETAEKRILEAVARFWSDIEAGVMPKADYERDGKLLALLRPPVEGQKPIDLNGDNRIRELVAEYEMMGDTESGAKKRREALRAEIVEKLDGHEVGTFDGRRITNKLQHRKETIQKAATFPVLRISKQKETTT